MPPCNLPHGLRGAAVGIDGFDEAVVAVVKVLRGQRFLAPVRFGARDLLRQFVIVRAIRESANVAQRVRLA